MTVTRTGAVPEGGAGADLIGIGAARREGETGGSSVAGKGWICRNQKKYAV
jgi:hypothetical protein